MRKLTFKCDCGTSYVLKAHNKHRQKCPLHPVKCSFCDLKIKRKDMNEHVRRCAVVCEFCSEQISRADKDHFTRCAPQLRIKLEKITAENKALLTKFKRSQSLVSQLEKERDIKTMRLTAVEGDRNNYFTQWQRVRQENETLKASLITCKENTLNIKFLCFLVMILSFLVGINFDRSSTLRIIDYLKFLRQNPHEFSINSELFIAFLRKLGFAPFQALYSLVDLIGSFLLVCVLSIISFFCLLIFIVFSFLALIFYVVVSALLLFCCCARRNRSEVIWRSRNRRY